MMLKFILVLYFIVGHTSAKDEVSSVMNKYEACGCKSKYKHGFYYPNDVKVGQSCDYHCCASTFIESTSLDFNISWESGANSSFEELDECFGQIFRSVEVKKQDEENLTCTITFENGENYTRTVKTIVQPATDNHNMPIVDCNGTGIIYASFGKNHTISCEFTQTDFEIDILWRKIFHDDNNYIEKIATNLPFVTEKTSSVKENGKIVVELILLNISDVHLGIYSCQFKSSSSVEPYNTTITNKEDPKKLAENNWILAAGIASCFAILFIFFTCVTFRLRLDVILAYKSIQSAFNYNDDGSSPFEHDVFIIHGPTSTYFVHTHLLDYLENTWNYRCFLPYRDILGGEESVEALTNHIGKSHRILIVISDCLLSSQWCTFMMFQGIQNVLESSSKILAISLSDVTQMEAATLEVSNMLQVLKVIKQIKYPVNLNQNDIESSENFEGHELICNIMRPPSVPIINVTAPEENCKIVLENNRKNDEFLRTSKSSPNFILEEHKYSSEAFPRSVSNDNCLQMVSNLNQRITNMISKSAHFEVHSNGLKRESLRLIVNPFLEENLQKLKEELKNSQDFQEKMNIDEKNPSSNRKKFSDSESSDTPLMIVKEKRKYRNNMFIRFDQKIFGTPEEKFWKRLHIHLPTISSRYFDDELQFHE